jgi:hypothetical protein
MASPCMLQKCDGHNCRRLWKIEQLAHPDWSGQNDGSIEPNAKAKCLLITSILASPTPLLDTTSLRPHNTQTWVFFILPSDGHNDNMKATEKSKRDL